MNAGFQRNIGILFRFHLFTSAALPLAANWVLTDLVLLRMNFDLTRFGAIKSSMFLLPALAYWCLAGRLSRMNCDAAICRWSYLIRIALPFALPLTALATEDPAIRLWSCVAVFSLSYTAAAFANNTLLSLFRRAVDAADFNRRALFFTAVLGVPAALLGIPLAWWLDRPELTGAGFFRLFLLLELLLALFEIPAFLALHGLRLRPPEKGGRPGGSRFGAFRSNSYRKLLTVNFLLSLWMGMIASYLVVYLIRVRNWNAGWIVLWEALLCAVILAGAPYCGRFADRHGYAGILMWSALAMLAAGAGFYLFPTVLPLFMVLLLIYNGNNGLVSNLFRLLVSSASAAFAAPGETARYVAASSLVQSLGSFAGCCAASTIFGLLSGAVPEETVFLRYFAVSNLLLIPLAFFAARLKTMPMK